MTRQNKVRLHSPFVVNKQLCDLGIPRHVGESQGASCKFSDSGFQDGFCPDRAGKDHQISSCFIIFGSEGEELYSSIPPGRADSSGMWADDMLVLYSAQQGLRSCLGL